jgi:hypothetical protein
MIIDNINFESLSFAPYETDAALIVDSNAVLASTIAFKGFQMVAGKYRKIRKHYGGVDLHKLSFNERRQAIEALRMPAMKNQICIS